MSFSQSLAPRPSSSLETIQKLLGDLVARDRQDEVLTAVREIPARRLSFVLCPAGWQGPCLRHIGPRESRNCIRTRRRRLNWCMSGKNVVVVTPTASGKTLCYNLPVLDAVLGNPDTRALYLFPTKALAQDQLAELQDLGNAARR